MDHPNQGGDQDEQFPVESLFGVDDVPDSSWDVTGTVQHGAPTGSLDEFNSLNFPNFQTGNFGNQSVAGAEQPVLLGPDSGISFEDFVSLNPDSFRDVAGTVQHGAPTGSLDEFNSLNFHNLQAWNFCNHSVAGTEQPAPAAPEFAYNENQTLSSHDKELNKQQCDQLIVDTFGLLLPPTMPSGPPDMSYSIDLFGPLHASRTQFPENQMLAGIQPLIQEQLNPAAEKEQIKREKKRAAGRKHCQKKKEEKQKLIDENKVKDQELNALRAQIQILEAQLQKEQQQLERIAKAEAEKEHWKKQYRLLNKRFENNSRKKNQLHPRVKAMEKQMKYLGKLCIKKSKKKLKKQVMRAETAEETKNDN